MINLEHDIVEDILAELLSRNGFDDWYMDLDEDIQQEIELELVSIIIRHLYNNNIAGKLNG